MKKIIGIGNGDILLGSINNTLNISRIVKSKGRGYSGLLRSGDIIEIDFLWTIEIKDKRELVCILDQITMNDRGFAVELENCIWEFKDYNRGSYVQGSVNMICHAIERILEGKDIVSRIC